MKKIETVVIAQQSGNL